MQTKIPSLVFVCLLLAVSCTKETVNESVSGSSQNHGNPTVLDSFYIGEKYGGGIICYIDETGQHGLIAAKVNLGPYYWYNGNYIVTGAKSINYGDGLRNTKKIVKAQGKSVMYAALACLQYRAAGYNDWYLPTKSELNKFMNSGLALTGYYWSSSEYDSLNAWESNSFSGNPQVEFKDRLFAVRPVRSF